MKQINWQTAKKWLDGRPVGERAILLCGVLVVLGMVWLSFVHDVLVAAQEEASRNISIADGRIAEEENRQREIQGTYTSDPNNFALSRQEELREATNSAEARLNQLYGELISPQQMSQVLTTILQRETMLKLVSLENKPSEALLTATVDPAADPADPGLQVFKHGLRMVFEGNYLEAVRYLRSLEELEGNFFWESLNFSLSTYPDGQITFDIYTLSTQQGWIGV